MKAEDFKYFKFPFKEFNKAQKPVIFYLDKDVNLVVSLATGVGKTCLAEGAMAYHLQNNEDCKVAYISPFKSLSQERYDDWSENEQFKDYGVLLSNSDVFSDKSDFENSRLLVMTMETLDSKSRNYKVHKWLEELDCIVFDEIHLIGKDYRGSKVEACLIRLATLYPHIRFILLSGTMSNYIEVAKWVKSLNGKETKAVRSEWRPVKIKYEFHGYESSQYYSFENKFSILNGILNKRKEGEKVIVFVQSKKLGNRLVKKLKSVGIGSAFHNASLTLEVRKNIEKAFKISYSGLDILISTATLGSGVNL